jgi:hypothetical protein
MSIMHCLLPVALAASLSPARIATAQDDEDVDRTPVRCISMRQVESTRVVDDQTILFYRRGGIVYMNVLEQNCPTLERNRLFRYRINRGALSARLCDSDSITVVDRNTSSLTYHCRLGQFHPIDVSRAEELLLAPSPDSKIDIEPAEVPDNAPNESDEAL